MEPAALIAIVLLVVVGKAVLCGWLSSARGHGWTIGIVLGLFLGILGVLIVLLVLGDRNRSGTRRVRRSTRRFANRGAPMRAGGGGSRMPTTQAMRRVPLRRR